MYTAANKRMLDIFNTFPKLYVVFRDWNQIGVDIDGEAAGDYFGFSVSLSSDGTIVAISGHLNDGTGNTAGHVRVLEWVGSVWTQLGLDIDAEAAKDSFGYSVSLSSDGMIVAIGGLLNDGTGTDAGHVRVLEWSDSAKIPKVM